MGGAGNLVPIGRFSQICRLTIKAPRYYDDQGLLKPALVDHQSGYRHYGLGQVAVADRIRTLREIDMPLEEIAAALRERDPAAISARLTVHQRRLEQQIAALESALATLLGMLEPGDDARGDGARAVGRGVRGGCAADRAESRHFGAAFVAMRRRDWAQLAGELRAVAECDEAFAVHTLGRERVAVA